MKWDIIIWKNERVQIYYTLYVYFVCRYHQYKGYYFHFSINVCISVRNSFTSINFFIWLVGWLWSWSIIIIMIWWSGTCVVDVYMQQWSWILEKNFVRRRHKKGGGSRWRSKNMWYLFFPFWMILIHFYDFPFFSFPLFIIREKKGKGRHAADMKAVREV